MLVVSSLVALALVACGDDSTGDGTTTGTTGSAGSTTMVGMSASGSSTSSPGGEESTTGAPGTTAADSTGDDSGSSTGMMTGTTGAVEFEMSSPAFEPDGPFPGTMHVQGGNVHPQLDWVGAPAGTMSFGVFFRDDSISFNHSAIWNIPADVTGVPEAIEQVAMPGAIAGAVQCRSWINQFGYGGPGSPANFYTFTLYALDTDDLSGEIDQDSSLAQVRAALQGHAIEEVTLTGQSSGPN